MINVIKDTDAIFHTDEYDVVLVGTSIYNMLSNGFQAKMRLKYPKIEEANNSTGYADLRKLGKRITVDELKPVISLMYICKWPQKSTVSVDYDAIENCLATADVEFRGKKVMLVLPGCSPFDGNGDKERVMDIINNTVKRMNLDVYDYIQLNKKDEYKMLRKKYAGSGRSRYENEIFYRENFYVECWERVPKKLRREMEARGEKIHCQSV